MKNLYVKTVVVKLLNLATLHVTIVLNAYVQNMLISFHGDREETCHGILRPMQVELSNKKGYVIVYKCDRCGAIRRNKSAEDDNNDLLIKLTVAK